MGYTVENWDTYFGQDGIISKSANCIKFGYHIFTNAKDVSDTCDNGSHHIIAIGDYFSPTNNNNNLDEDYNFEFDIKINLKDEKAQCKITNHISLVNSILKELHCTFKGTNTFEVKPIIINIEGTESFFIDEIKSYKLKECGSSLLKLSSLIIISLILI